MTNERYKHLQLAVREYCKSRNMTNEMFWNMINHVEDGEELLIALKAQEQLLDIVENYYIMRKRK